MTAPSAGVRKSRFMPHRLSGPIEPSTSTANPTSTSCFLRVLARVLKVF
jgi:hypothetical protein